MKNWLSDRRNEQQQCGQALTELILVIPLILILIQGIPAVRASLKTSLSSLSSKLDAAISAHHVPEWQRAHWPEFLVRPSISSGMSEATSYLQPQLGTCRLSRFNSASVGFSHNRFESEMLLRRLERIRALSLSVLRTACITEATPKAGPVNAPLLVAGLSGLPSESLRKEGLSALCSIVSRTSEGLRSGALLSMKIRRSSNFGDAIRSIKMQKLVCVH